MIQSNMVSLSWHDVKDPHEPLGDYMAPGTVENQEDAEIDVVQEFFDDQLGMSEDSYHQEVGAEDDVEEENDERSFKR